MRDLLAQALAAVATRPSRSIATGLGTVVGVAAVVGTLGVGQTASHQVSSQFDALRATEVSVTDIAAGLGRADNSEAPVPVPGPPDSSSPEPPGSGSNPVTPAGRFDAAGIDRLRRLNGVIHAGLTVSIPSVPISTMPVGATQPSAQSRGQGLSMPLLEADDDALAAMFAHVDQGRLYDHFHVGTTQPVCLIGRNAASQLGLAWLGASPTVWVGDQPLTVIGVLDQISSLPGALGGIVVPPAVGDGVLAAVPHTDAPEVVMIRTAPGAAQTIAEQAPYALLPNHPELAKVVSPPDPKLLRNAVTTDLGSLVGLVAGISLLIGALGIANTTALSVMERVPEIGLRRAVGAGRPHIAAQLLVETTLVGTVGGLLGDSLGVLAVVAVSSVKTWAPTLDPGVLVVAPLLGTLTGLVAGVQPAWRASRIEPVDALRR